MNTGLHRIELAMFELARPEPARLEPTRLRRANFGGLGGPFQGRLGRVAAGHPRSIYLGASVAALLAILTAGAAFTLSNWSPSSRYGKDVMGTVRLIAAASAAPERVPAISAPSTPDDASLYPDTVSPDAVVADGLTISSQSWRRGGLGSNALMTFTLRNSNDFAVKDIDLRL
jgi:hypothetical protein